MFIPKIQPHSISQISFKSAKSQLRGLIHQADHDPNFLLSDSFVYVPPVNNYETQDKYFKNGKPKLPIEIIKKMFEYSSEKILKTEDLYEKGKSYRKTMDNVITEIKNFNTAVDDKTNEKQKTLLMYDLVHELFGSSVVMFDSSLGKKPDESTGEAFNKDCRKMFSDKLKILNRYQFILDKDLLSENNDMSKLFNFAKKSFEKTADEKKITVKISGENLIKNLKIKNPADNYKAFIVMHEILHNSLNSTPQRGHINVKLEKSADNKFVIFSVKDNGKAVLNSGKSRELQSAFRFAGAWYSDENRQFIKIKSPISCDQASHKEFGKIISCAIPVKD